MKPCRDCREEIREGARRCPRCGSWQSRWFSDARDPWFQLSMLAVLLPLIGLLVFVPMKRILSPPVFEAGSQELAISDSEMQFFRRDGADYVAILGHVKNDGQRTWQDLKFHVELYDVGNRLIDAFSDRDYNLVVAPGSQTSFRATGLATRRPEAYSAHKVEVSWASSPPWPF